MMFVIKNVRLQELFVFTIYKHIFITKRKGSKYNISLCDTNFVYLLPTSNISTEGLESQDANELKIQMAMTLRSRSQNASIKVVG